MNKERAMKFSSIIVGAITIYMVIIWEPKENGERVEKNLNSTNDVVNNEEQNVDSIAFQIDELDSLDNSNYASIDIEKGLGSIAISEKNFDDLINKISSEEKDEIKDVLEKLSITDCSKIDVFLNQEDNSKGMSEALEFIRKRLSDEDYEKFQEIISKYIDITNINSNI